MALGSGQVRRDADRLLERDRIAGVRVHLSVGGNRYLHVRLDSDGTLERGGGGEHEFATRLGTRDLFAQVLRKVSPELLRWAGQSWSDPRLRGKTCELLIGFKDVGGHETITRWEYGTESHEPPTEIRDFILGFVEATNPWYRRQIELRQERATPRPGAAWRLVPLLPTCEVSTETIQ